MGQGFWAKGTILKDTLLTWLESIATVQFWRSLTFSESVRVVEWTVMFFAALSILNRKRDPVSCLGWLLAVVAFPFVGTALYILGGVSPYEALARRRRVSSRLVRSEEPPEARTFARAAALEQLESSDCHGFENTTAWTGWAAGHGFFNKTAVDFLENSTTVYSAFEEAISRAERYILVQFYQIVPDAVGRHFYGLLADKARQGVAVHVLFDAMGSYRISANHLKMARASGIKIHSFMGFHPLKRRLQINWRNHRKLLIVDGHLAFVGGLNLGEMYLEGQDPDNPAWRDVHFKLQGEVATHLERVFREDWHFATGEALDLGKIAPAPAAPHHPHAAGAFAYSALCLPVASGPADSRTAYHTSLLSVLYEARRRIWISTAYFVPDKTLLQAMRQAIARGVDVQLVIPRRSNHPMTDFCTTSYYQELLDIGLVVHHYNPGMLHAKLLLADDDLVLTGSSNQDYRSFFLNFELDLLLRDRALTAKIEAYFTELFGKSYVLTREKIDLDYRSWGLPRRIFRLCSPLM
jgi:cardiolipin synthase